jgi:hypothetical protein
VTAEAHALEAELVELGVLDAEAGGAFSLVRSPYSTSAPVYDVVEADGSSHLVLKDLTWTSLLPDARRTKPRFLHDPRREIGLYREVLGPRLGTARCHGTRISCRGGRSWLLLEKVDGRPLVEIGEPSAWQRAARWVAAFHAVDPPAASRSLGRSLVRRDPPFYRRWLARARAFAPDARLDRIAADFDVVVDRLVRQPQCLIHGELYASNVLVSRDRVCAIDWEMAGFGPALLDLAALTSGRGWSGDDRRALVSAYRPDGDDAFAADLAACRVALAVQWAGWSPGWDPPADRTQDWLADAVDALEVLGSVAHGRPA